MSQQTVEVTAVAAAPPAAIFEQIADPATWPRWSHFESGELERPGTTTPFGVGAIRRMKAGRTTGREEVVAYDEPNRFAYALLSGLPLRDYRGEVTLVPVDGGTRITWRSTFRPKLPLTGRIWHRGIAKFLGQIVDALVADAARQPASGDAG
jgi:uncharacterized protein YndB with AHSA1/START domain